MRLDRFKIAIRAIDQRAGERSGELPLLSVSQHKGVVPRAELAGDEGRALDLGIYKVCRPGDIVLNRMSAYNGAVGLSRQDGIVSPDYLVLRPTPGMDGAFLAYLVRSQAFVAEMTRRVKGIGSTDSGSVRTPRIGLSELGDIRVHLPEFAMQRAIADYLDRETAQIDSFIAKNEELIALLGERRDAIVANEVTGTGLPGGRRQVDADWFDSLPAHWEVLPLRAVARTFPGGTPKSDDPAFWSDDEGAEWISIADMKAVDAGRAGVGRKITRAGLSEAGLTPKQGPLVLFAMYASVGEIALLRRTAVWNQAILGLEVVASRYEAAYLYWALRALRPHLPQYFRSNTQNNLNAAQVRSFRLPTPPLPQQRDIASRIEAAVERSQQAIAVAERGIALARERRAALISAAVTGKIDVGVAA